MNDDSDDPVMALLAIQRAVLAAVENLAGQVEAMQGKVDAMGETLAQLVAGSAGASGGGVGRVLTLGDRFRQATDKEAAADPELRAAQGNYMVAQAIAKGLNKGAFAGGGGILRQARPDSRREILLVAAFYGRARKATAQFYPAMATHFEGVWPNAPILNEAERTPKSLCRFIRFQHGQPNLCGTSRSGPAFDRRVN